MISHQNVPGTTYERILIPDSILPIVFQFSLTYCWYFSEMSRNVVPMLLFGSISIHTLQALQGEKIEKKHANRKKNEIVFHV